MTSNQRERARAPRFDLAPGIAAAPALAQDPVAVDPDHYKVVFENDQVRVLRITYGPQEESVMHEHPAVSPCS